MMHQKIPMLGHNEIHFQSCLLTLPAYFPLKLPYGQFPPKIPGPVSQTKLKTKKQKTNYGEDAVLIKKKTLLIN
jgi:hypothetical protein